MVPVGFTTLDRHPTAGVSPDTHGTSALVATRSPVARRNTASNEGAIDSIDENATARMMFPFIRIAGIPHGDAILDPDPRMRPRTPPRRIASVHHDSGIAVTGRQATFDRDAFKPHRALAGIHHDSVPSEARDRTVLNHHTGHSLRGFLVPITADAIPPIAGRGNELQL